MRSVSAICTIVLMIGLAVASSISGSTAQVPNASGGSSNNARLAQGGGNDPWLALHECEAYNRAHPEHQYDCSSICKNYAYNNQRGPYAAPLPPECQNPHPLLRGNVTADSPDCVWDLWAHKIADTIAKSWKPVDAGNVKLSAAFTYAVVPPGTSWTTGKPQDTNKYRVYVTDWSTGAVSYAHSPDIAEVRKLRSAFQETAQKAIEELNGHPDVLKFRAGSGPAPYPESKCKQWPTLYCKAATFSNNGGDPVTYGTNPCDEILRKADLMK